LCPREAYHRETLQTKAAFESSKYVTETRKTYQNGGSILVYRIIIGWNSIHSTVVIRDDEVIGHRWAAMLIRVVAVKEVASHSQNVPKARILR
jgi:hypothetical protein